MCVPIVVFILSNLLPRFSFAVPLRSHTHEKSILYGFKGLITEPKLVAGMGTSALWAAGKKHPRLYYRFCIVAQ